MKKFYDRILPYLYSTPFFLLLLVFMICPFFLNAGISFTNYSMSKTGISFIGLKNYTDLFSNPSTWAAMKLTFIFIAGCVSLTMLLGMFYAVVMTFPIKGIGMIKAFILMPWIIPESVTAYVWKWLFSSDTGMIYYLLLRSGLIAEGTSFFFDRKLAMFMIILANVWRTAPFVAIMTYAKLTSVPASHVEAAEIDGAGPFKAFLYIKIPWMMPILKRCALLLFVWSFNSFSIIYILTNGGPAGATTTLPYLIRQAGFQNFNFGQATALSVISLMIILLCFAVMKVIVLTVDSIKKGGKKYASQKGN